MNRFQIITRVRSLTRDLTSSIFREQDIVDFVNEGIDRCKQVMPELGSMVYLDTNDAAPIILPDAYHSLLSAYATARCYSQDERHYQATTFMNEFETKMDELRLNVENGRVVLKDVNGNAIESGLDHMFVVNDYYFKNNTRYNENFDFPDDEDLQEG